MIVDVELLAWLVGDMGLLSGLPGVVGRYLF